MEARAKLSYARIAPRKVSVVLDLIRNQPLDKALAILQYTPKAASELLYKLVKSAAANAERAINNFFIFFFRQNCCVLAILRINLSILIRGRPYYSSRSRVRLYRTYAGLRELYSF